MNQKTHANTPARSEKQIREELVRTLEGMPAFREMADITREMYVASLPIVGALIERQREENAPVKDVRQAVIATAGQMIVDIVLMTTPSDEASRKIVLGYIIDTIEELALAAIKRALQAGK